MPDVVVRTVQRTDVCVFRWDNAPACSVSQANAEEDVSRSVDVLVRNRDGSDFYRLLEPARVLADEGYDIQVIPTAMSARPESTVVLSRPLDEFGVQVVGWLRDTGHRVIVDMDDDFDHLALTHGAHGVVDTSFIHASCTMADVVTTTTPALDRLYGYGHGVVLPNAVPARYLDVQPTIEHGKPWVGWYGSKRSHPEDPQVTGGAVGRALADAGAVFSFVGGRSESPWIRQVFQIKTDIVLGGWYMLDHLADAIANFTVGVVPLANILFNDAKSWLKASELAAVGVPVVMSPTPSNRALNKMGVGVLAEYPNDWYRQLCQLLTDSDHRQYIAACGREAMARLTYESLAGLWCDVWCPGTVN